MDGLTNFSIQHDGSKSSCPNLYVCKDIIFRLSVSPRVESIYSLFTTRGLWRCKISSRSISFKCDGSASLPVYEQTVPIL